MKKAFVKMHGLGNDFVIFDGRADGLTLTKEQIRHIANRRTGIGCDQLIVLERPKTSTKAMTFMRIYNIDGSEAEGCGNATRCVASLLKAESGQDNLCIETLAGELFATALDNGLYTIDMGAAKLVWQDIPLSAENDTNMVDFNMDMLKTPVAVNVGNPHVVFFVDSVDAIPLSDVGPKVETAPLFPKKINVEIAQVLARDKVRMRVWERGSGITQACGTAACATIVAGVRRNLTDRKAEIVLDGGSLFLEWRESDGHVLMTGPVAEVFRAEIDI